MDSLSSLQQSDEKLKDMISYLQSGTLPSDKRTAMKVLANALRYVIMDGILYHLLDLKPKECIGDARVTQLVVQNCLKSELNSRRKQSATKTGNGMLPRY